MSLGTLTAIVDAETRGFVTGMANAAARMESFAREVKKLGREVATAGLGLLAFAGAALRMAATVDSGAKQSLLELKGAMLTLAVQISSIVAPAVHELSMGLRALADWFAGLSPHAREQVAHFGRLALEGAAVAFALSKVAGIVSGLSGAFAALAGVVAAIGVGTLGAIVVVILTIVAAVALLHKAWRTNWNGIQEVTKSVIETISTYWGKFAGFLGDVWGAIVDDVASKARAIAALVLLVLKSTGKLDEAGYRFEGQAINMAIGAAADTAKSPMAMKTLALEGMQVVKAAGLDLANELKLIVDELKKAAGLGGGGNGGHAPQYSTEGQYSDEARNRHEKDLVRGTRMNGAAGDVAHTSSAIKDSANDFWEGMEDLGPLGARIAGAAWSFKEAFVDGVAALGAGLKVGGQMLLGKLGDLGQVISAGIQGFQSGGIWGAIIAVFVELLSKFERFQELIDIGNGQIQEILGAIGPGLSAIVDGLREFMGASGILSMVVSDLLVPVFKGIGKVLANLAPIIEVVAAALEPLQPIFDLLGMILGAIGDALGYVIRFVGATILGTVLGLEQIWANILDLIWQVLASLGANGAALEVSKALGDAQTNVEKTKAQLKRLVETGNAGVGEAAASTSEKIGKLGKAADDASQQLTNLPSGFKVALEQFNATLATSSSGGGGAAGSTWVEMRKQQQRFAFRNTGNATAGDARTKRNSET